MDHNNSVDSPLPSTVQAITADCSQFRILVVGKTGCGKSSLINKVFGVEKANVSHHGPGEADITAGLCPSDNERFILHDSEGFEPGEDVKLTIVKNFIEERRRAPQLKDRLHAIWICMSVPAAGDRVAETGVEQIVEMVRGHIPLIIVFTKYDGLVMSEILDNRADTRGWDDKKIYQDGKDRANKAFKELCVHPLTTTVGNVSIRWVSTKPKYEDSIKELTQATEKEIQRQTGVSSYTEPHSLNFSAAQRVNTDIKVAASIDIGRLKYWSKLLSNTDFKGNELRQCLDVIHRDIVSVWNIRNSSYLAGGEFKAQVILLVDDLIVNPSTPTPNDGLSVATVAALASAASSTAGIVILLAGLTVLMAGWLVKVYQNTVQNIACVMAYIVDLTILMDRLSTIEMSKERVISTVQEYAQSREIAQVHNDIRSFTRSIHGYLGNKDYTLDEIIRLIEQHHVQVTDTPDG